MKPRLFVILLVVIGLLAAMSSAAAAQAPSGDGRPGFAPAFAPELTGPNVEPEPPLTRRAAGRGEAGCWVACTAGESSNRSDG